jgi:DNA-binding PadR family transcriptional regulator
MSQLKFFLETHHSQPALHPDARKIIEALSESAKTQSELFYLFNGRLKKSRLMPILEGLASAGIITSIHERSGGRPRTVWSLTQQ